MIVNILLVFFSYIIGSIPFGLLFARTAGVDVRNGGSGNIGATNVNRLVGKKLGALTLFADIMKGFIPPIAAVAFIAHNPAAPSWLPAACGLASFSGHLFPVWLRFRGGKGVATALGVFFFVSPTATMGCIAVFACVVAVSRYVSLGSLLGSAAMPLVLFYLNVPRTDLALALIVVTLVWIKHWANIKRLLQGEEAKLGQAT